MTENVERLRGAVDTNEDRKYRLVRALYAGDSREFIKESFGVSDTVLDEIIKGELVANHEKRRIARQTLHDLDVSDKVLMATLNYVAPKPKVLKNNTKSIVAINCVLCGKPTKHRVGNVAQCLDHNITARMSQDELNVLEDFLRDE